VRPGAAGHIAAPGSRRFRLDATEIARKKLDILMLDETRVMRRNVSDEVSLGLAQNA